MILPIIGILFKSYFLFNTFQKSYYEYRGILKYTLKKHYIFYTPTIFILILFLWNNTILYIFFTLILLIKYLYVLSKIKLQLKFTKRIIRAYLTLAMIVMVLSKIIPFIVIDLLIPFIIVLVDLINKPIQFLINQHYIKKASNTCKNIDSVKIAITGSYGKTSVKNYIYCLLKQKYIVKASPKSYNTPLGLAKFINNSCFDYCDFAIMEFGARRSGDILLLKELYDYDIAVVTGIGMMHIDTFKTQYTIVNEKMSLANFNNKIAILNYENEFIREYALSSNKYTYGFNYGMYQAKNIKLSIFNTCFDLYINNEFIRNFSIKPLGKGAVINMLVPIILCDLYKLDYSLIERVESVENRLSLRIMSDYYILDDAYNSNILGVKYALEVVKTYEGKRFIITPGFAEMDLIKNQLAEEYAKYILESVDCVILVENDFTKLLLKYLCDIDVIFVEDFKKGFDTFLKLKEEWSVLLIENDLLE